MHNRCMNLLALLIGLVFIGLPNAIHAQLVLYDDFSERNIDPEKWHGQEGSGGAAQSPNGEIHRSILGRRLQLHLTSYGETSSDSGRAASSNNRLRVNDPAAVTTLQAVVTVTEALAQDCPANGSPTRAQIMLNGSFFNDGSSAPPDDRTGDVLARIEKRHDSSEGNTIRALILICNDAGCDSTSTLESHVFAATWKLHLPDTLKVQWDPANDQFSFELNPGTKRSEISTLSYSGIADDNPPVSNFRELRVQNQVANCTAERQRGSITALFDNVMVNP